LSPVVAARSVPRRVLWFEARPGRSGVEPGSNL